MVGLSVLERYWRIKTILLGLKFSQPDLDIPITCLLKTVSESQGEVITIYLAGDLDSNEK